MTIQEQLAALRQRAGKALNDARETGKTIAAKLAKNEAVADEEARFEQQHKEAMDLTRQCQTLERTIELDAQHARMLETPAPNQPAARSDADAERNNWQPTPLETRRAKLRHARLLEQQRQMFAGAGVNSHSDFERFNEAHADAFMAFLYGDKKAAMDTFQAHGFKPMESLALVSTQGDAGGFLAPDEFRNEVLKDMAGMAVIRSLARVERTGAPALVFPTIQSATTDADVYSTGFLGSWKGEGYVTGGTAPPVQNQPKFGQTRIPVFTWAPDAVEITQELLGDAQANVDGIVAEAIAEVRALDEDAAFINGDGVGKPLGLLNAGAGLTTVNTGSGTAITYNGLVDLFTNVPSQYRNDASFGFLMTSLTYGAMLKLADSTNQPLFGVNTIPGTLWGKKLLFSELLPDIGSGNRVIVAGAFRYYVIADRQELRLQRLTERYAPNLGILATARLGGQPTRKAAFRVQICA